MSTPSSTSVLPPLFARWAEQFLPGPIPPESRATCSNCVMLTAPGEPPHPKQVFYSPQTKCCTYVPILHNFLVGGILTDDDPELTRGRTSVEDRMRAAVAVTPLGLGQPAAYSLLYENATAAFGRSRHMRCPHYIEEGGLCGVWKHRESTCATWFCKHVRGAVGYGFWRNSLHLLLSTVERELAAWCVLELDIGTDALRRLMVSAGEGDSIKPSELDAKPDPTEQKRVWGKWFGREREFYGECARRVAPLDWEQVISLCGTKARALAELTRESYAKLVSQELPANARAGSFQLVQIGHETTRVASYSDLDPLDVPNPILKALHYFDGGPTNATLEEIARKENIRLEESLVRKLVDFGLLAPPDEPTVPNRD